MDANRALGAGRIANKTGLTEAAQGTLALATSTRFRLTLPPPPRAPKLALGAKGWARTLWLILPAT